MDVATTDVITVAGGDSIFHDGGTLAAAFGKYARTLFGKQFDGGEVKVWVANWPETGHP